MYDAGAVPIRGAFFGEGTGRIHLDDLGCERSETSIIECPHNGVNVNNCNHREDAGVICLGEYECFVLYVHDLWHVCTYYIASSYVV